MILVLACSLMKSFGQKPLHIKPLQVESILPEGLLVMYDKQSVTLEKVFQKTLKNQDIVCRVKLKNGKQFNAVVAYDPQLLINGTGNAYLWLREVMHRGKTERVWELVYIPDEKRTTVAPQL